MKLYLGGLYKQFLEQDMVLLGDGLLAIALGLRLFMYASHSLCMLDTRFYHHETVAFLDFDFKLVFGDALGKGLTGFTAGQGCGRPKRAIPPSGCISKPLIEAEPLSQAKGKLTDGRHGNCRREHRLATMIYSVQSGLDWADRCVSRRIFYLNE